MASKKSKSSFDKMVKELDVIEQPLVCGKRTRNQTLFHSIGGSLVPTPPEHTFQERIKQEKDKEAGKAKQPRTKRQPNLPPGYSTGGASPPDVPPVLVPQFSVQNYSMPGPPYFYERFMAPGDSSKPPEPVAYHVIPRPSKLLPYRSRAKKSPGPSVPLPNAKGSKKMPVAQVTLPQAASKLSGRVRHPDDPESESDLPVAVATLIDVQSAGAAAVETESDSDPDDVKPLPVASKMFMFNELVPGAGVVVTDDNLLDVVGLIEFITKQSRRNSARVLRRLVDEGQFDQSSVITRSQAGMNYVAFFVVFCEADPFWIH